MTISCQLICTGCFDVFICRVTTDLVAADLYWGSEPCIRRTKTECNSIVFKRLLILCMTPSLYCQTLNRSHSFLFNQTLPVQMLLRYASHQGTEFRAESMLADPYHWTTSLALLPYLFIFKRLIILHFCISLGVKREWMNKALPLLPNNRGYPLL